MFTKGRKTAIRIDGRALPLAAILVALTLLAAIPLPARESTGRIEGSITLSQRLVSRRTQFLLYPEPTQAKKPLAPASISDELRNVVVYLESAGGEVVSTPPHAGPFLVGQKGLEFEPHVLAVAKGTTVEFPNRDLVFHNVFSLSKAASFDLGRYPSGSAKSVRFDHPGLVKVFCHIHSDMTAIILVLDNWLFTTPAEDGRYFLDSIPPGEYTISAWHERARLSSKRIRVEAGQTLALDFVIPLVEYADGG